MTMLPRRVFPFALAAAGSAFGVAAPMPARAQTCAAPIQVSASTTFTASTCDGTNDLPYISSGTAVNRGPDVVYQLTVPPPWPQSSAVLQPEPGLDLALFQCVGHCSTFATCFSWIDNGPGNENMLTLEPGYDLFLVVAHPAEAAPMCGNYSLKITYPPDGG